MDAEIRRLKIPSDHPSVARATTAHEAALRYWTRETCDFRAVVGDVKLSIAAAGGWYRQEVCEAIAEEHVSRALGSVPAAWPWVPPASLSDAHLERLEGPFKRQLALLIACLRRAHPRAYGCRAAIVRAIVAGSPDARLVVPTARIPSVRDDRVTSKIVQRAARQWTTDDEFSDSLEGDDIPTDGEQDVIDTEEMDDSE